MFKNLIIFILFISFSNSAFTDNNSIFRAGFVAGFNASQVDGDRIRGYNKFGFNGGITSMINLSEKFSLNIDIAYSQKGAKSTLENTAPDKSYFLQLDYIDVPVVFQYHDFERVLLGAGLSVNAQVRYREIINDFPVHEVESTPYSRFDLNALASAGFLFTEDFGAQLRFAYSIIPVRPAPPSQQDFWRSIQFNNLFSLRVFYFL
ncbi:MAG: PorT family protein [Chitinophagaceae bacterium]|nr:MAG: PorT family protein [Chitinophagaceae bacterium]